MKAINSTEAESVVGGCRTCSSYYQTVTYGGVASCRLVTSCCDKYGSTTTSKYADPQNCGISTNPTPGPTTMPTR